MSAEFQNFLKEKGIHHETTVPHQASELTENRVGKNLLT